MIDEEKRKKLWELMPTAEGKDCAKFRLDSCGALMEWDRYGDRQSDFGWEIDHVVPKSLLTERGATENEIDDEDNLRPMHWKNNDTKSADYPEYQAKVSYENGRNIEQCSMDFS